MAKMPTLKTRLQPNFQTDDSSNSEHELLTSRNNLTPFQPEVAKVPCQGGGRAVRDGSGRIAYVCGPLNSRLKFGEDA